MKPIHMKIVKRLMVTALSLVMLIAMPVAADAATTEAEVFNGYSITIHDYTTPATTMRGRLNDPNIMCFVSASDKELGVISYADYQSIIQKYKVVVPLEGGGSVYAPPSGNDWHEWFAAQFNMSRGLDAGSGSAAQMAYSVIQTEEYRQELIRLTNAEREKVGLPALDINEEAMALAQVRAMEIVDNWSHTRPNGERKEVDGRLVNENITIGDTPESAISAWMNSEGHRGNMLNSDAYAIGVGAYYTGGGWFCVQLFVW